jgi:hypothetical protein
MLSRPSGGAGNEGQERRQRMVPLHPFLSHEPESHHCCGGGAPSSIQPAMAWVSLSDRHSPELLAQAGGILVVPDAITPPEMIFW